MDVLTAVEEHVRDGVRSRGIDPLSDPAADRELFDSAVAAFGPLQSFFDDPEIEEPWINE